MRLAIHRVEQLGGLSAEGFSELVLAVHENPEAFCDRDDDRAFLEVVRTLERYEATDEDDDLLSDEEYFLFRLRRFDAIAASCSRALALDPDCLDAALLRALVSSDTPEETLEGVLALLDDADVPRGLGRTAPDAAPEDGLASDAWDDVLARPRLRAMAAAARLCAETARFRMACELCRRIVRETPSDPLGVRNTWAVALARLEDEDAFNELWGRFGRAGNAWFYIAHALLLYKLDRIPAARRALKGYCDLCEGGAYALLRPTYVDTYLPDRPDVRRGSFEEAVMAVHELDPIIMDAPDFVNWALAVPGMEQQAKRFAEERGFEY